MYAISDADGLFINVINMDGDSLNIRGGNDFPYLKIKRQIGIGCQGKPLFSFAAAKL